MSGSDFTDSKRGSVQWSMTTAGGAVETWASQGSTIVRRAQAALGVAVDGNVGAGTLGALVARLATFGDLPASWAASATADQGKQGTLSLDTLKGLVWMAHQFTGSLYDPSALVILAPVKSVTRGHALPADGGFFGRMETMATTPDTTPAPAPSTSASSGSPASSSTRGAQSSPAPRPTLAEAVLFSKTTWFVASGAGVAYLLWKEATRPKEPEAAREARFAR